MKENNNLLDRRSAPKIHLPGLSSIPMPIELHPGLLYFEKKGCPVFKLDIVFPHAGLGNSSLKKENMMVADLLLSGTSKYNAQELNERLDSLGSYYNIYTDYYKSTLSIYGKNDKFSEILALWNHILNDIYFDPKEIEIYINQKVNNLNIQKSKTSYQAKKCINKAWFGSKNVLGYMLQEKDFKGLNINTLSTFYAKNFLKYYFILSGEIESKKAIEWATKFKITGSYSFCVDKINFEKRKTDKNSYTIEKSNQSSVIARVEIPNRLHKDYAALSMLNLILGGYFGARIMKNIREEKGWTYGMYSVIRNFDTIAYLEISGDVLADKVGSVISEIEREVRILCEEEVSKEEWDMAKNYYLGSLQRSFDSFFSHSDKFLSLQETTLNLDWYYFFVEEIKKLEAADVKKAANTYLNKETLFYTWSGPKQ